MWLAGTDFNQHVSMSTGASERSPHGCFISHYINAADQCRAVGVDYTCIIDICDSGLVQASAQPTDQTELYLIAFRSWRVWGYIQHKRYREVKISGAFPNTNHLRCLSESMKSYRHIYFLQWKKKRQGYFEAFTLQCSVQMVRSW